MLFPALCCAFYVITFFISCPVVVGVFVPPSMCTVDCLYGNKAKRFLVLCVLCPTLSCLLVGLLNACPGRDGDTCWGNKPMRFQPTVAVLVFVSCVCFGALGVKSLNECLYFRPGVFYFIAMGSLGDRWRITTNRVKPLATYPRSRRRPRCHLVAAHPLYSTWT